MTVGSRAGLWGAAGAAAAVLAVAQARGDLVTYEFTGKVDVVATNDPLWEQVAEGDEFKITFEFDTGAEDLNADPKHGLYTFASEFSITAGAVAASAPEFQISVLNLTFSDSYLASAIIGEAVVEVYLSDDDAEAFDSDALPVFDGLDAFDYAEVYITVALGGGLIGTITDFASVTGCYADFDGGGTLDLFDFLAFTNAFNAGAAAADCDGSGGLSLFDFLCFVGFFNAGC